MNYFQKPINIVFIGHVDHGKSTLISRVAISTSEVYKNKFDSLLKSSSSTDLEHLEICHLVDQFAEEQQKAMTIDTSQVQISLEGRLYNLIDAPGHFELLKNMISGASRADAAVLVIDYQEGLKPQTYKHLEIINLLGCSQLIVALNKIDLPGFTENKYQDICQKLKDPLKNGTPILLETVPISAKMDLGIKSPPKNLSWYKGPDFLSCLSRLVDHDTKNEDGSLVIIVQDNREVSGASWISGKIVSGTLKKGQKVYLLPMKKWTAVEKIVKFPNEIAQAGPGDSISLNLSDQNLALQGETFICNSPEALNYTSNISGRFLWLDGDPLNLSDTVTIRCSSQRVQGRIKKIEQSTCLRSLTYGEFARINIELNSPIVQDTLSSATNDFNRFIIERDGKIVSGGIAG